MSEPTKIHTTHFDDCGCKSANMQKEIDELKARIDELSINKAHATIFQTENTHLHSKIETLKSENQRLTEVLEFYADIENFYYAQTESGKILLCESLDESKPTPENTLEVILLGKKAQKALSPKPDGRDVCPPHSRDASGERCTKCGDKDWMT